MKSRKALAVPALALTLTLAISACGGPGDSGQNPEEGPSQAPITAQDINPQDVGSLQQGGRLRQAISDVGTNWNPMHIDGNNADLTDVRSAVTPTLFDFDAAGTATPNPDYLLEATASEAAPTVLTMKLNPKAIWNDGDPIVADDFIATWKACGPDTENGFNCASRQGYDAMTEVKAGADEFEVIVTYEAAYPDWSQQWTSVMKAESVKDADTFNKGWSDLSATPEWLSGPFKIESYDKTQKVITEVPNDKWWGEKPKLDELEFRAIAPDATAAAYANDELDTFDIGPDPDAFQRASAVAGGVVLKAAGPNFRHFTFNQKAGLLTDKTIRQAIVRGLDREEIGISDLAGIDWPAKPLNNHVFMENQEGYVDSAEATGLTYDPEKAKADLEAAGWTDTDDDGIREKDGKPLEVKFMELATVPVSENEAKQTQAQLAKIGIKIDIVSVPIAKFQDGSVLSGGEFEIIAFSWIGTPYPFTSIKQIYGTGSDSNYSKVSLPEVDDLVDQIDVETDKAKRIELSNQADQLLWEDVNTLPLYQRPELIASKEKLANFGAFGLGSVNWTEVGYQK